MRIIILCLLLSGCATNPDPSLRSAGLIVYCPIYTQGVTVTSTGIQIEQERVVGYELC